MLAFGETFQLQSHLEMSCILRISGKKFDVDAFLNETSLRPIQKNYKGEPKFKTRPDGAKLARSHISFQTSNADFDNLKKQITDTIRYLQKHKTQLSVISKTSGIDFAVLDFGIELRIDRKQTLIQSDVFPNKLLSLAGELRLDIELSIYPKELQLILEKRRRKK